ncbi:DUF805 domain-containing protein [Peterkaempfera bronchialis]|uniref:hypothetical protein n=1 Tax=Peterkaempfera bronchialis TaxID=2126346 RepID=UPI001E5C6621|nr:hypothetical protein [Peterkaempfera bronchialis]
MQESDKAGGGADLPEDGAQGGSTPEGGAERPAERRPPAGSQAEQDAIFKELVASFDAPVDLRTWPDSEDLNEVPGKGATGKSGPRGPGDPGDLNRLDDFAPQPRPRPRPGSGSPVSGPPPGPRDWDAPQDPDDDHFVPPEPPPLPRGDTTTTFAWIAVLGGPALLLFSALAWRDISGWPALLGVVAFIGGFVTLVARMRDRDEDDEDPHGGAVV